MASQHPQRSPISDRLERAHLDNHNGVPLQPGSRLRDISGDFIYASQALKVGQLVKDANFTLFDSVQALEIMDPKMDPGCLEPGESLDDDFDICRTLLPEEIIWIMDELICYQMAWHEGYALAQNVLTSVHIDHLLSQKRPKDSLPMFKDPDGSSRKPNEITQVVLRAFCVAVTKSCDIAMEIVQTQQYYEEEDFSTATFDMNLLTDITDDDYLALVQAAQDWLEAQLDSGSLSRDICSALVARLTLNCRLLSIVLPIHDKVTPNVLWGDGFGEALSIVQATHTMAKPVEGAFSQKLQRKLASNTPPRPINIISFETACLKMQKLREDLVEAASADTFASGTSLQSIEAFLWAFASREPLALPRSVVQMFLFGEGHVAAAGKSDGIQHSFWQELQDYLPLERRLLTDIFEVEAPHDEAFKCASVFRQWHERAQDVYVDFLKSLCQNRCRIRRCLVNAVSDIDVLLNQLIIDFFESIPNYTNISERQRSKPGADLRDSVYVTWLACWIIEQLRLRVIDAFIGLGFEQDVFLKNEYAGMYALEHRILVDYFNNLSRRQSDADQSSPLPHPRLSSTDSSLTKAKSRLVQAHVKENTLKSMSSLYAILVRLDALPLPPTPYCTPAAQSAIRLAAFASKQPPTPALRIPSGNIADVLPASDVEALLSAAFAGIAVAKEYILPLLPLLPGSRTWLDRADLAPTQMAADHAWEEIKGLARTCFALGKLLDTLVDGVARFGGEEGLKGKVTVVMPETHAGRWILPSELVIEKVAAGGVEV